VVGVRWRRLKMIRRKKTRENKKDKCEKE